MTTSRDLPLGASVPIADAALEQVNGGNELIADIGARVMQAVERGDWKAFFESPFAKHATPSVPQRKTASK